MLVGILMNFCPDFATNSRKEWRVSLFQSNLRKRIGNLPKILKSVKIIQYYSIRCNRVLSWCAWSCSSESIAKEPRRTAPRMPIPTYQRCIVGQGFPLHRISSQILDQSRRTTSSHIVWNLKRCRTMKCERLVCCQIRYQANRASRTSAKCCSSMCTQIILSIFFSIARYWRSTT